MYFMHGCGCKHNKTEKSKNDDLYKSLGKAFWSINNA